MAHRDSLDGHIEYGPPRAKSRWRVAELVVNVSAVMEGEIQDWPRNIQDGIYKALFDKSMRDKKNWKIIMSRSDTDVDSGPYVHVVAVCEETIQ